MAITREKLLSLVQNGMKRENLGLMALEKSAGVPKDTVRDFLRGKTQILRADKLEKILAVLGKVAITGIVGKDAEIIPAGADEKLGDVDCPPGFEATDLSAVRIKGDAMSPVFYDGWIIYYSHRGDSVPTVRGGFQVPYNKTTKKEAAGDTFAEFLNKPCVVKLPDGRLMLRTLKRGNRSGKYTLVGYNTNDIENTPVEWAAKIVFIKTE